MPPLNIKSIFCYQTIIAPYIIEERPPTEFMFYAPLTLPLPARTAAVISGH